MLGDDRIPRRLGQNAAESRPLTAGTIDQRVKGIQHAVNVQRRCLDRNKEKVGRGNARQRSLRAETGCVDDDRTAVGGEILRGFPCIGCCILHHWYAAERALTPCKAGYRTLRIGIDEGRKPTGEVPMNRQATRKRTLATTTFHCCNGDDLSHGRPAFSLNLLTANHL
jgi:hypothetical protein